MDVKEVTSASRAPESVEARPPRQQRSLKDLSTGVSTAAAAQDIVSLLDLPRSDDLRGRANTVITVINLADEATGEIERLVRSIDGIVEQASQPEISTSRRDLLETEANTLVDEIRRRAVMASADGVRPLAGDPIRLEIEQKIGKALDLILPKHAEDGLGLEQMNFSQKEAIIQTRAAVAEAQARLQEIKEAVDQARSAVHSTVDSVEVALQNSEAARVSIRDVDAAVHLAAAMTSGIRREPRSALDSIEGLSGKSLGLLE